MVVGLVGCGRWGRHILRDLVALGCEVPVVARSDESKARAVEGGASAIVATTDGLPALDAAVVATTTSTHALVLEDVLERDVPVFCEKPLTNDRTAAARLAEFAPDRLFVMDKWRYHPGVLELAAIARERRLGAVSGLSTVRVGWGTGHDDVDPVWVLAPHDLSIALEVLGAVPRPSAAVAQVGNGVIAGLSALLDGDGAWHAFEVSARSPVRSRRVVLHCDEGIAVLAGAWDEHVTVFRGDTARARARADRHAGRAATVESAAGVRRASRRRPATKVERGGGGRDRRRVVRAPGPRSLGMIDATVLLPTHRHAAFLPFSIESALDQEDASIELFVVGDGVEDATREVVARYEGDLRLRFFDLPKGPRLGEAHRHGLLQEAQGRVVCYLSDDDILLRGHVAEMLRLLEDADFAHPPSARFGGEGELLFFPWNYGRPEFRELAPARRGSIGLTGAAHTMDAYRRLPHGWRTTPPGTPTDHYMWIQFLELPGYRGVMGRRLTYLSFPEPVYGKLPDPERAAIIEDWYRRSREPGFDEVIDEVLRDAIWRAAEDYHVWARREQLEVEEIRATRTWRARERLTQLGPLRRLLARRSSER